MTNDPNRQQNDMGSGQTGQRDNPSQQQQRKPDDPQKRPSQGGHDIEQDQGKPGQEREDRGGQRRAS